MNFNTPLSVLVATGNMGKLQEIQSILSRLSVVLHSLNEFQTLVEVEEVGTSFEENAILKATGYAAQTGFLTLADDSGLEVESLNGAPGVLSARYAGDQASDSERIAKLLSELSRKKDVDRRARFVCVIAIADSNAHVLGTFEGTCEGRIAISPQGTNGFGYDPVFIPDGYSETFGLLTRDIKDTISHRGRALMAASSFLSELSDSDA